MSMQKTQIINNFNFSRERGLIWVCDVRESSSYLNDNVTVDDLEEFLPRLYWVAYGLVMAARGEFVKWNGDGFTAWFPTTLDRTKLEKAALIFHAVFTLSTLVNVTQLGLSPKTRFRIRHGVAYEPDALRIHINQGAVNESFDLIGRGIVLAYRMAGIESEFPGIVTQKELLLPGIDFDGPQSKFKSLKLTKIQKQRYFKGEDWGTDSLYVSITKRPTKVKRTIADANDFYNFKEKVKHTIDLAEGKQAFKGPLPDYLVFIKYMSDGPSWCKNVIEQYLSFLRDDMFALTKKVFIALQDAEARMVPGDKPIPSD